MLKVLMAFAVLVSGTALADGPSPTPAQRLACYEAGYRVIFIEVMKLTQDRTGHRGLSKESYEEALSEATYVAAQENGLIKQTSDGTTIEVTIARIDSPLALIGLAEGQAISAAGLQRRFRVSIPMYLGAHVPGIYAYAVNSAIENGLSGTIEALPECVGVFSKSPAPTRLVIKKIV